MLIEIMYQHLTPDKLGSDLGMSLLYQTFPLLTHCRHLTSWVVTWE